jgi:hypothetical protein
MRFVMSFVARVRLALTVAAAVRFLRRHGQITLHEPEDVVVYRPYEQCTLAFRRVVDVYDGPVYIRTERTGPHGPYRESQATPQEAIAEIKSCVAADWWYDGEEIWRGRALDELLAARYLAAAAAGDPV